MTRVVTDQKKYSHVFPSDGSLCETHYILSSLSSHLKNIRNLSPVDHFKWKIVMREKDIVYMKDMFKRKHFNGPLDTFLLTIKLLEYHHRFDAWIVSSTEVDVTADSIP